MLTDKLTPLATALADADVPFAIGDPLAHAVAPAPSGSPQIDVYLFVAPDDADAAIRALGKLGQGFNRESVTPRISETGQARVDWDGVPVDLFFQNLPFLEAAAKRTRIVPFGDIQIPVLSPEDLVVCKAMFNRRKDWADIEQLLYVQGDAFEHAYARNWLIDMVGASDQRVRELDLIATQVAEWERGRRG